MRIIRTFAILLSCLLLTLASCASYEDTPEPTSESTVPEPAPQIPTPPPAIPDNPPMDMTWISPGKVNIGNFYAGARAEYFLLVHNGKDTLSTFNVKYQTPNHVGRENFALAPKEAESWVIIADPTPVIAPKETKEVLVALDMPATATVTDKNWEFWIVVTDTTQVGMVRTQLASRWLVSMR